MSQRRQKLKPGSVISGTSYKVIRHIGSGAMGAVYEALHCELDKLFVVKVLHQDLVEHDDPVRRLRCEWQLLAKLEHPNIVSVTDAGFTDDGVPYFVMERLEGETLYSRMHREPRWAVSSCIQLALELLDGLIEAHAKGIIHRDIKPSNIFLSRQFGAKLLDFGIAKLLHSNAAITAKGVTLGTPRYMAPEQACGQRADCRSDLYAIGVILFELVVGKHPFAQAHTPAEMLIAQAGWEPPPMFINGIGKNDEFVALVGKLLAKDPIDRPATAVAARDCFRRLSSRMLSKKANVDVARAEHGQLAHDPEDLALTTKKIALARWVTPARRPKEIHDRTFIPQESTGLRGSVARRRSPWQVCLAILLATAALSASSLATPFPIHRVLSTVWFGTRSSTSKLTPKSSDIAEVAAIPSAIADNLRPAAERTANENAVIEPEKRVAPTTAAPQQRRRKVFVASSSTAPKTVDSEIGVESSDSGRVHFRANAEYDNLTRR